VALGFAEECEATKPKGRPKKIESPVNRMEDVDESRA